MDLAHLSTNRVVFLSLMSPFHLRLALSGSMLPCPPLMTDSSASSPSSPNTKPAPLQGRWCCLPNSGLSGSSSASVPLPMPDTRHSKQRFCKTPKLQFRRMAIDTFSHLSASCDVPCHTGIRHIEHQGARPIYHPHILSPAGVPRRGLGKK